MLKIYMKGEALPVMPIIQDVEAAFGVLELTGSFEEREFLRKIDRAEWDSPSTFIDRFGIKLRISELSTGCKAALCVLHYTEQIIDLKECGLNAVSVILSYCTKGNVILTEHEVPFTDYGKCVDLKLDNYRFKTLSSFNRYLDCERFCFKPDLTTGEVELCSN